MFVKNLHRRNTAVRLWLYPPKMQHIRLPQLLTLRENSIFLPYRQTNIALNKSTNIDDNLSAKMRCSRDFQMVMLSFREAQRFFPPPSWPRASCGWNRRHLQVNRPQAFSPWANGLSPSVFEGSILLGKFTWRLKILNFGTQGFQQNTLSSKYIRTYENHEMIEHIDGCTATGSLLQ